MSRESTQKTGVRKVIVCAQVTGCFSKVLRKDINEVTFDQRPHKVGICSVYVHFSGESKPWQVNSSECKFSLMMHSGITALRRLRNYD